MDQLKPPKPFVFGSGNIAETWKTWKRAFDFFMVATEADGKDDKIKTSILLTCIGDKGREIYETFDLSAVIMYYENEFIIQSVEVQQGREELPDEFCIQKEMPLVGPMMFEDYCDDKVRCEMINRVSNESQTRNVHQVSQWTANLPTNGKNVEYKLDTGAEVNVLPKFLFDHLYNRPKLSRSAVKLSAYNSSDIPVEGKCIASIQHEGKMHKVLFMVVKTDSTPILGLNACQRLNLNQKTHKVHTVGEDLSFKDEMLREFNDCFGEMGTIGTTYKIELKENVKPVVVPTRKVPFRMMDEGRIRQDGISRGYL